MGKREIANYIEGVTSSNCCSSDPRVDKFLNQWDSDKDGNITAQDFTKFYFDCATSKERSQAVWKNLKNARFRKDLKRYDQPIEDFNEPSMMRYHLVQDNHIYQILFALIRRSSEIKMDYLEEELRQRC